MFRLAQKEIQWKFSKMAGRKKKTKKLSEDDTDELVNDWIASIDDLREFFFQHSPEEEGDIFYDDFLEKFQNVEQLFRLMVEQDMIVQGSVEDRDSEKVLSTQTKLRKGQRDDN